MGSVSAMPSGMRQIGKTGIQLSFAPIRAKSRISCSSCSCPDYRLAVKPVLTKPAMRHILRGCARPDFRHPWIHGVTATRPDPVSPLSLQRADYANSAILFEAAP